MDKEPRTPPSKLLNSQDLIGDPPKLRLSINNSPARQSAVVPSPTSPAKSVTGAIMEIASATPFNVDGESRSIKSPRWRDHNLPSTMQPSFPNDEEDDRLRPDERSPKDIRSESLSFFHIDTDSSEVEPSVNYTFPAARGRKKNYSLRDQHQQKLKSSKDCRPRSDIVANYSSTIEREAIPVPTFAEEEPHLDDINDNGESTTYNVLSPYLDSPGQKVESNYFDSKQGEAIPRRSSDTWTPLEKRNLDSEFDVGSCSFPVSKFALNNPSLPTSSKRNDPERILKAHAMFYQTLLQDCETSSPTHLNASFPRTADFGAALDSSSVNSEVSILRQNQRFSKNAELRDSRHNSCARTLPMQLVPQVPTNPPESATYPPASSPVTNIGQNDHLHYRDVYTPLRASTDPPFERPVAGLPLQSLPPVPSFSKQATAEIEQDKQREDAYAARQSRFSLRFKRIRPDSYSAENTPLPSAILKAEICLPLKVRRRQHVCSWETTYVTIPRRSDVTLGDSSSAAKKNEKHFVGLEFDDTALFRKIRQQYFGVLLGGSLPGRWWRRWLSARKLNGIKLVFDRVEDGAAVDSGRFASWKVRSPQKDRETITQQTELLRLFRNPSIGKGRYAWVHRFQENVCDSAVSDEFQSRREKDGTVSPPPTGVFAATGEQSFFPRVKVEHRPFADYSLEFVEGWSARRILIAFTLLVVASIAVFIVWVFFGTQQDVAKGAAHHSSEHERSLRIKTGSVIALLTLLLGLTTAAAWVAVSWVVM